MSDEKNYDKQLTDIMNRLADSVLDLSDEQLIAEAKAEGIDVRGEAERVRNVLRRASKNYRMSKLVAAQRNYESQLARMQTRQYDLPTSASKRRELLAAVLNARPDIQPALLTAQYRDFKELSDVDVESFLKQLKELGMLDSLEISGE